MTLDYSVTGTADIPHKLYDSIHEALGILLHGSRIVVGIVAPSLLEQKLYFHKKTYLPMVLSELDGDVNASCYVLCDLFIVSSCHSVVEHRD